MLIVFGVAPVAAPLLGGQILAAVGWRGIFVTLAAYGLACVAGTVAAGDVARGAAACSGVRPALASYRTVLANRALVAPGVRPHLRCKRGRIGFGGLAALLPPMFVIIASIGAIMPTATALGLTPLPANAVAAAAVIATGQAALSALSGALASAVAVAVAPAVAMGIVVTTACLATVSALLLLAPSTHRSAPAKRALIPENALHDE